MIKQCNTRQYMSDKIPDISTLLLIIYGALRKPPIFLCLLKKSEWTANPQIREAVSVYYELLNCSYRSLRWTAHQRQSEDLDSDTLLIFFSHQSQVEIKQFSRDWGGGLKP